jgi:AsmA family protein
MSTTLKRCLVALLIILVLLVAGAVAVVNQLQRDPGLLEDYLSELLNRQVEIGRLGELHLGRESTLLVEDLTIANPDWADSQHFLNVQRARIHLDLASVWRAGPVVIHDLELKGVTLALQSAAEEGASWDFGTREKKANASTEQGIELPVLLEQAHITDSTVHYLDENGELSATLEGQIRDGDGVKLAIEGHWHSAPVAFHGYSSRKDQGIVLSGAGSYQAWQLELDGSLADPFAFRGLDFRLRLQGGLPLGENGTGNRHSIPLDLQLALTGSGRRLEISQGLLASGDSQLTLNGSLGNLARMRGMALDLVLDSPDIKPLLPLEPVNDEPVPIALEGRLVADGKQLRLQKVSGRSAGVRIRGELGIPLSGGLEGATLSARARGPSAQALLAPWVNEKAGDAPFELDLDAVWSGPQIRLDNLQLRLGQNTLDADLVLTPGDSWPGIDGRLHLSGKRAYRSLAALGFTVQLPDESFMFKADVAVTPQGAFNLTQMDAQLGRSDVSGSLDYRPGAPGQLNANLRAKTLDLRFFSEAFEKELRKEPSPSKEPKRQFDSNAPLSQRQLDARLIPDTPVGVEWLDNLEGKLVLKVDEVVARDDLRSAGEFVFRIADKTLVSEKMEWGGDFSSGKARLELASLDPGAGFKLQLQSHRLPLFWMLTGNPKAEQKSDYHVTLAGSGATVRALAGSLDGKVAIRGGGGQMNNRGLNLFFGDVFGEIFARINPSSNEKTHTEVICHSGGLEFDDGLVTINPGLVLRTEELDIALGGGLSLRDESFNLVFNTRSRKGLGISASKAVTPYLKLGGNFSHPRLGVNAKGVVVSGGAAMATGGLSIVAEGMWDRWVATSVNPCEAVFEQTNQAGNELKKLFGRP